MLCEKIQKCLVHVSICLSFLFASGASGNGASRHLKKARLSKTQARPALVSKSPQDILHAKLMDYRKGYRLGDVPRRQIWEKFDSLSAEIQEMRTDDRLLLLNTQASLLMEAGYPILAAMYSSQALRLGTSPWAKEMQPAWATLRQASAMRPIQTVLEVVASETDLQGREAPIFASDWYYYLGNSAAQKGDPERAITYYRGLKYGDRHYFAGKYQEAMILIEQEKLAEAESVLKKILIPATENFGPLQDDYRRSIMDFAYMGLGRVYYEQQRFVEAVKMYRSVDRRGLNFYDSLFEQAWAFFMGGYPMHALGAIHGAESPFYADVFNPEATLLRSMIHYWLCRYDDSRNALADFMEKYHPSVEQLKNYLDRKNLEPEFAYQLFENLISGVSSQSLGLPKAILETAAERDSMLFVRDQYASVIAEKSRLEVNGIFRSKSGTGRSAELLERWVTALRKDIGRRYLAELNDMKKDFDRLYAQAEFLYVELLMSEKDQILGKDLHASTKITRVSSQLKVNGWADKTQSWRDPKNGEYWWDEVGFYIAPVDSMCTAPQTK